jgi:hypothetical protein
MAEGGVGGVEAEDEEVARSERSHSQRIADINPSIERN